jgi:molybdopterin-guanine dinucleotide biosynthesis protein A
MGSPKPLLVLADGKLPAETLLARTVRIVREAGLSPLLVGRNDAVAAALEADEERARLPWLADALADRGPIGGLLAALAEVAPEPVLLLPTDLPFLTPALLRRFVEHDANAAALASRSAETGHWQPLPARFGHAALALGQGRAAAGDLALFRLLDALGASELPLDDDERRALVDLDTPADLARYFPAARAEPTNSR